MTTEAQEEQAQDQEPSQNESANGGQAEGRTHDAQGQTEQDQGTTEKRKNGRSGQRAGVRTQRSRRPTYAFDPTAATRAGLLHLADEWKETGSTYQAIHAYTEVLTRYPGTQAAAAATEGLVDMAQMLEQQGRFYTALNIFNKLEELV